MASDEPKPGAERAFRWRREDSYQTVTGAAFAKRVMEDGLRVEGPFEGYWYAMVNSAEGQELWRAAADLEGCVEQTAVTSNPAAGTISVDVKTFTGRGRVCAVSGSVLCDATVATRRIEVAKVSGANLVPLTYGNTATASTTLAYRFVRGGPVGLAGTDRMGLGNVEFAPGDILRVYVDGGQAGDDMSAIVYSYKETA